MNIAIIDDYEDDRLKLETMVLDYCAQNNRQVRIDFYENSERFLRTYKKGFYDIIFLDIYMSGITGMETAQKLRMQNEDCHLIFVTSSLEHAVDSYDVQATYYLTKPVTEHKFKDVMDICCRQIDDGKYIEVLANRLPTRIPIKHILYAETYQNAITLHTNVAVIKTYMTFQSFLELLEEDSRFLCCYKGCAVNMDHISGLAEDCFIMDNEDRVPIRKRELNAIKNKYTNYLLNRF